MKQISFLKKQNNYGGGFLEGAHVARTFSKKRPIHLVLKSKNGVSLYKKRRFLIELLKKQAKTFGIKIYDYSVQSDHIHLYKGFIRAFTGITARKLGPGLWRCLPFTRLLSWGRDFLNIKDYFLKNKLEVAGILPYSDRKYHYVI